jgi:hypothetical protein
MNNTFDLDNLFDEVKADEVKQATEKNTSSTYTKFSEDDRFIQFKAGNTYQFRLLYHVEDPTKRKRPFIAKYDHTFWDEDAEYDKLKKITCPTSEYILNNNGFSKCPVCKATRKFYKDKEDGSATAEELYKQFRRKFHGYALVYVVNDPTNEDNNGKVKIMHFGITIHRWLKLQIFGIGDKDQVVDDEVIGKAAFDLEDGYNLKVKVGKKGEYNKYDCEFARKTSTVEITKEEIAEAATELKFDEEFLTFSTDEEIQNFYKTCVLAEEVNKDASDELDLDLDEDEKAEIINEAIGDDDLNMDSDEPEIEETTVEDDDDIDIDNIIANVKKKK